MGDRGLNHEEIRLALTTYAKTGEFVVPLHALVSERQKLDLITSIIPQALMQDYEFFFRFYDDLTVDIDKQSPNDLETEKESVVEYLASTGLLQEYGKISKKQQRLLAQAVVENLVRLV